MKSDELQLLSVLLGDDMYGIDITKVQEIRALGLHRNLPNTPDHCVGIIDFRNYMVPVLDLRAMFDYPHTAITANTVIVVLLVEQDESRLLLGIVVDSVSDVLTICQADLKDSPTIGEKVDTSFIAGMFKHEGQIAVVLRLNALLQANSVNNLKALLQTEQVPA